MATATVRIRALRRKGVIHRVYLSFQRGVSGRPGRLPAQAPHRSGRAEFPHPALRAHGFAARRQAVAHLLVEILASSAIRWSDVWMDTRFDALSIFPPNGSMPRRPLPFSGSLEVRFPGLIGTMRRSDFLPSIPGGSLTRPPVPPSCCFFAPAADQHCPRRARVLITRLPYRFPQGRRPQDLPSSRQIHSIHALLPSDPGGTGAPGLSAPAVLPSDRGTASAPTNM